MTMRPAMQDQSKYRKLSVIIPVFNEAENVGPIFEAVKNVFESRLTQFDWEVVFVDDGSSDQSWERITHLADKHAEANGVALSRNFGKELALTAGVEVVGESCAVICMDADLQHPPELIPEYVEKWEAGADVVVGIRRTVADYSFVKQAGSSVFYWIMRNCSEVDIPPNSTDFRLLDWRVVEELKTFKERSRMFRGLIDWMGFKKSFIEFDAPSRLNGEAPGYSIKKLFNLAINSITSFSLLPLRATGYLGLFVSFCAALLMFYMVVTDVFDISFYTPLAYIVVCLAFLMGVVLCGLGMLALYIGHIHTEVVGRPLYILRDKTFETNTHSRDA